MRAGIGGCAAKNCRAVPGRSYRLEAFRDGYDPGVRRSGLGRVGDAGIWHAVCAALRKIFFVREFVQAALYLLGGSGNKLAAYQV